MNNTTTETNTTDYNNRSEAFAAYHRTVARLLADGWIHMDDGTNTPTESNGFSLGLWADLFKDGRWASVNWAGWTVTVKDTTNV